MSEEIKRFNFVIEKTDGGRFVKYDDYAALRATIAERNKEIERLKEELQDQTDKANSCLATMDAAIDEYGKAEAELADLRERIKGIDEVYKKLKNVDWPRKNASETWQAIRAAAEEDKRS